MLANNLNLFFTFLGASATAFLGFLVFLHDRKSCTNKIFIIHSFIAIVWAVVNYFSLNPPDNNNLLWIRLVIFFAVPYVLVFLLLVLNFPNERLIIKKRNLFLIIFLMIVMMAGALSPFVFQELISSTSTQVSPTPGILMPLFGPLLVFFFLLSFFLVIKKYFKSDGVARRQWLFIGSGLLVAYTLLIFFVFVRVVVYQDTTFVIYSPLFILPIFAGTAFAILKHQLFRVKVIATEILIFGLLAVSLIQLFLSESTLALVINLWISALLLLVGVLLIRSVLKEVREREQLQDLTKQLQDVNAKLDNLSRFKSQMLSLAAHQIKAPLATIKGFSTILIDGLYGPVTDKIKDTLKKIRFSADDLINLINTLLDLRHVEEGKMDYNFQAVKIKDVATEAFDVIKFPAQQKGIQFTLDCSTEANVNADPQKLKQVLQNLIDNAVKYTSEGFVKVDLKEEDGFVIFSVTDSGLGIPADLLPHLFDEEFVRDERVKKEILGTGLGLYIAKKIINDHRGEIGVKSDGPGKGSCFFVRLKKI
ncbi:MAG: ATP-binding protein [Candidatus Paceibacterota bacterium]|jgi:signal transduction histidine kinase